MCFVCADDCPVSPSPVFNSKQIDMSRSSGDVLLRLASSTPALLLQAGSSSTPQFAAVCGALGVFTAAWQQLLEAGRVEYPSGAAAHAALIDRLLHLHKYLLVPYSSVAAEQTQDEKQYQQAVKAVKAFAKSKFLTILLLACMHACMHVYYICIYIYICIVDVCT